jgi:hypothetical protein
MKCTSLDSRSSLSTAIGHALLLRRLGEGGGELRVALDERSIPCPSRAA